MLYYGHGEGDSSDSKTTGKLYEHFEMTDWCSDWRECTKS